MMSQDTSAFRVEVMEAVAVVTIDVQGETVNTLKAEFASQIRDVFAQIKSYKELQGVVFISGKKDSFIAGADISMLDGCNTSQEAEKLALSCHEVFAEMENFHLPIVAAIHGSCLGGGLEFALACHSRIISNHDKTRLGLPEVQLGILPGGGGTQRLPRIVGVMKSIDMMLTGRQLRAKQAAKMKLADDMVPSTILLTTAIEKARQGFPKKVKPQRDLMAKVLETNPMGLKILFDQARKKLMVKTKGNYPAPERILDVVSHGLKFGRQAGLAMEAKCFGELVMSPESAELRNIFFATTEMKKEFGVEGVEPEPINSALVLGGGLMGGGIANVTAIKAGTQTRIKDISETGISHALRYSWESLSKQVKRRQITPAQRSKKMSLLSGTLDYQGICDADIVIEAVFEDLKLKRQMVMDVEEKCKETTIFASNTSSLPIQDIASAAARPENVIGLHYFSPVDKMPLVEVIAHEQTSPQTIATTVAFARKQGKTPIVVKDGAGFYVNRILALYVNEAAQLLLAGEPINKIDSALVQFGFPVGPMMLLDEVGIDVGSKIAPILEAHLGSRFTAPVAFAKLEGDERKGKKNKRGFYDYRKKAKGKKQVDDSVYQLLNVTPAGHMTPEMLADLCTIQMLNEAARCLEEGIVSSPRDGDIGAIFGIGFPPFRGGPFRYMDALGILHVISKLEDYSQRYGERFEPCQLLKDMAVEGKVFYK